MLKLKYNSLNYLGHQARSLVGRTVFSYLQLVCTIYQPQCGLISICIFQSVRIWLDMVNNNTVKLAKKDHQS